MPACFCITVRFLNPAFHGRGDGGAPEWPPSPLRLFQALVAAAAARRHNQREEKQPEDALRWLERQNPPTVIAPKARAGEPHRLYVPDNVTDLVAASWARGGNATIADYRTEKDLCPMCLVDGDAVHYLWSSPEADAQATRHQTALAAVARSITHLGWGIDVVVAEARTIPAMEAEQLPGCRWHAVSAPGTALRTPTAGTLAALGTQHQAFLGRLPAPGSFNPVPPLSVFGVTNYRCVTDPPKLPFAAFSLLKPDASGYRPFDTVRHAIVVAGMLRNATAETARQSGWAEGKVGSFVLGHGEAHGQPHQPVGPSRFAFIPLPSIEPRGAGGNPVIGAVRRVLVTVLEYGHATEVDWAGRVLSGAELVPDLLPEPLGAKRPAAAPKSSATSPRSPQAILTRLPANDRMIRRYTALSTVWATVTPMVLPGYDDPKHYRRRLERGVKTDEQKRLLEALDARIDALIRKAIVQAGLSSELAQHADIDYRKTGYWPGTALAMQYIVPQKLARFPRLHVRIRWLDADGHELNIPGPICLGGGRFYGLGLFAAIPPSTDGAT